MVDFYRLPTLLSNPLVLNKVGNLPAQLLPVGACVLFRNACKAHLGDGARWQELLDHR